MSFGLRVVNRAVSQGCLVALLTVLSLLTGCVSAEKDLRSKGTGSYPA